MLLSQILLILALNREENFKIAYVPFLGNLNLERCRLRRWSVENCGAVGLTTVFNVAICVTNEIVIITKLHTTHTHTHSTVHARENFTRYELEACAPRKLFKRAWYFFGSNKFNQRRCYFICIINS